jgi:hypothetical protein
MLFVLTREDFDTSTIKGVFSTAEKAKQFVETVMGYENRKWSSPNLVGVMWTDTNGGSLFITPTELDPTTV